MARVRETIKRALLACTWPPVPLRYLSARKIANYYLAELCWLLGTERMWARPYKLTFELTNICNLQCPQCPTGRGLHGRKASMVALEDVERVMDELSPYVFQMDMHNWGESLLHKKAVDAIRICEERGVMTLLSTNFNVPFDDAKAEALVRSGLSVLGVSIDGPDQESYEVYRVKGRLDRVLENVERLQRVKRRLGSASPKLVWIYVVFRHNQDRIEEARALAESYGMEFSTVRGGTDDPTWETTEDHTHPAKALLRGRGCKYLYSMTVVNADLGVSPCCVGEAFYGEDDFGDVRDGSFASVWNGGRYRAARALFRDLRRGVAHDAGDSSCARCPVYTYRRDGSRSSGAIPTRHPAR